MNSPREILQHSKCYSAVYLAQLFSCKRSLCAGEFIRDQAHASFSDLVVARQTKFNLGTEYFYKLQLQIMSITQRAWKSAQTASLRSDSSLW